MPRSVELRQPRAQNVEAALGELFLPRCRTEATRLPVSLGFRISRRGTEVFRSQTLFGLNVKVLVMVQGCFVGRVNEGSEIVLCSVFA